MLDLEKAYDWVVRQLLLDKLTKYGVPTNFVNQLLVFLLPILFRTAGDLTESIAVLTTGLLQGVTASLALFIFLIGDLNGDLCEARDAGREPSGPSLSDIGKLVTRDVILIARMPAELQVLLNMFIKCSETKQHRIETFEVHCGYQ